MKQLFSLAAVASVIAAASAVSAVNFDADFETNQSANFATVISSDANANFTYNSSTHVQVNPPAGVTIGPAPNTVGATENVLRLNANVADAVAASDAVNVYPNVPGLGANWSMTWDCFIDYNGPAAGGTGSTQMLLFGATNSNAIVLQAITAPAIAGDGFFFTMTGEGGASADYRFYSGSGTIAANNAGVSWFGGAGGANVNNLDAVWSDTSTGYFRAPASTVPGPYETVGSPGKQWNQIRLSVVGTAATVSFKRPGDASFTDIGTATVPATANQPFIGFSDINTGQPSPIGEVADQFVLVDNLNVNDGAGVGEWSLY